MDGIGSVVKDKEQRCSTGCVRPIPYVRGMFRNVPGSFRGMFRNVEGTFRMPESSEAFEECSGMFQECSACPIPVEASEEAFEECSGTFRKALHASGMFQERSACLTPVGEASGGQYRVSTRTSGGIGRHMYAQHHHHPTHYCSMGARRHPFPVAHT